MKLEDAEPAVEDALVTPLAGVWIEIEMEDKMNVTTKVTPLAGVWIEIMISPRYSISAGCHSPCGSVD